MKKSLRLILLILPAMCFAQNHPGYHIDIRTNMWRAHSGKLTAITETGLTYKDRKSMMVTIPYTEIKKINIFRDKRGFDIVDATALASVGTVIYGISSSKSITNSSAIAVLGTAGVLLTGYIINSIVHPPHLSIKFDHKADKTMVKDGMEHYLMPAGDKLSQSLQIKLEPYILSK